MSQQLELPDCNHPTVEDAKTLGAFYTDAQVADFLVRWAVRSRDDLVMDPSFGGGVFLSSACKYLRASKGRPGRQVYGAEIDRHVYTRIATKLAEEFGVGGTRLFPVDFFWLDPAAAQVDVVVGNPPFIRYQRFTGETRRKALQCAAEQGVQLTELTSSWAPFIVHSVAMLREGGRLGMVVPMELSYATYARPVLEFLRRSFRSITLLTFRRRLFPDLNEDTLLLLAEQKVRTTGTFHLLELDHAGQLTRLSWRQIEGSRRRQRLDEQQWIGGAERLIEYSLPSEVRALYRELKADANVGRLGDLADVGIGYVTGANDFFHLTPAAASDWRIPATYLKTAVRRGRSLAGLRFTADDWLQGLSSGETGYLLHVEQTANLPDGVASYLLTGERGGVHKTYKCRTRNPWWRVPHVYLSDAFLTYMSGASPRLVANHAGAVAPNSLHILRLHATASISADQLAVLWQTSVARLSVEIEGHAMGGGMLKVEPTEAERILLPYPALGSSGLADLAFELDEVVRRGGGASARVRADEEILQKGLGLTKRDCAALRRAIKRLCHQRHNRTTAA